MAFYNPEAETTLMVDGSPYGLGAILVQKQNDGHLRPVAYASRTLNDVERRYSQIERECLAVTWGIEKFHTYLYGLTFKVITDHKPLVNIFKPTHKPPARLERMLLRLQCYKFNIEFQSGALNPADILSRSTYSQEKCEISNITEGYMDYVCENAVPMAMTLDQIDKESSQDKFIQELIKCIQHDKWPKNQDFKIFYKIRNELSVHNNIVLRGNRIVIPQGLRPKEHSGANPPRQLPITPTELPETPWQIVGMDLTGPFPGGEYILVVIDYYSRYPEVEIMKLITSRCIIQRLMKIFATHGLPSVIKTDNAPNMVSQEITNFFTANGIKHQRVTPYYPQAAGLVENFNKTIAKCVKTANNGKKNWRTEIYKFLMT
ncbi:uncharacterized protein K02A2.6-like [Ruditapes philippinarum]|uniref:uncharacterized protein K02A2.6-like n=1 Tax=Ruditapes philippinarum TaxID=129788 RepID=UPI00295BAE34|nr:uncharacterized protein K02A2.6-like [Ruditapes philippinarum]